MTPLTQDVKQALLIKWLPEIEMAAKWVVSTKHKIGMLNNIRDILLSDTGNIKDIVPASRRFTMSGSDIMSLLTLNQCIGLLSCFVRCMLDESVVWNMDILQIDEYLSRNYRKFKHAADRCINKRLYDIRDCIDDCRNGATLSVVNETLDDIRFRVRSILSRSR